MQRALASRVDLRRNQGTGFWRDRGRGEQKKTELEALARGNAGPAEDWSLGAVGKMEEVDA